MTAERRGGKRLGAGSKPVLSVEERLYLGSIIDNRIKDNRIKGVVNAKFKKRVLANFPDANLDKQWERINSIPLPARQVWSKRLAQTGLTAEDDDSPISQLVSDIAADIGEKRYFINPATAPYGVRRGILADVAKQRGITVRMAERCLEEYRAFVVSISD